LPLSFIITEECFMLVYDITLSVCGMQRLRINWIDKTFINNRHL